MHFTKQNILAGLAGVLLVGTLVISVKGNMFKGSFDLKDTQSDVHVTAFALMESDFNISDLTAEKISITYTLDKDATDIFLSISGKDKNMKIFSLDSTDMSQGNHSIKLKIADFPKGFITVGQIYDIRMIAYNNKQEISDFKNLTVTLAEVPKVTPSVSADKGVHKIISAVPSASTWANPKEGSTIDIGSYKDQDRIVITWKDDANKLAGARQSDVNGNYMMGYRWKLVATPKSTSDEFEKMNGITGATVQWQSNFPNYESGGDTQSSSASCIVPMKSDGATTLTPRWTCTEAIIPYDALKDLTAGGYTLGVQAGDGISGSAWSLVKINLENTESSEEGLVKKPETDPVKPPSSATGISAKTNSIPPTIKIDGINGKWEAPFTFDIKDVQKVMAFTASDNSDTTSFLHDTDAGNTNNYYLAYQWIVSKGTKELWNSGAQGELLQEEVKKNPESLAKICLRNLAKGNEKGAAYSICFFSVFPTDILKNNGAGEYTLKGIVNDGTHTSSDELKFTITDTMGTGASEFLTKIIIEEDYSSDNQKKDTGDVTYIYNVSIPKDEQDQIKLWPADKESSFFIKICERVRVPEVCEDTATIKLASSGFVLENNQNVSMNVDSSNKFQINIKVTRLWPGMPVPDKGVGKESAPYGIYNSLKWGVSKINLALYTNGQSQPFLEKAFDETISKPNIKPVCDSDGFCMIKALGGIIPENYAKKLFIKIGGNYYMLLDKNKFSYYQYSNLIVPSYISETDIHYKTNDNTLHGSGIQFKKQDATIFYGSSSKDDAKLYKVFTISTAN